MSQQVPLFVDSVYEGFDALVLGCGGYKKVAAILWPTLPVDRAARDLADCLNPDNARKLSLDEVMLLLQLGRSQGVHIAAAFINERAGYAPPVPVDPETEKQRLQREFVAGVAQLSKIGERISKLVTP